MGVLDKIRTWLGREHVPQLADDPEVIERITNHGRDAIRLATAVGESGAEIDRQWRLVDSIAVDEVPMCNPSDSQHLRADIIHQRKEGEKRYKNVRFAAGPPLAPGGRLSFVSYQGARREDGYW